MHFKNMKLSDKKKVKNPMLKKKPITKPKKEKILFVAQEFKFARLLSGNEKKTRDRVLKTLKKWLSNCFEKGYEFKEDDFIRVWKGLFYAVWMSDKPLVQEELCDSISEILDLFPVEQIEYAIMMIKAGFRVLATEWYGLDQHRMDKFLMLVRRFLRGGWRCLERGAWGQAGCDRFADMMMGPDGLLAVKPPSFARNALSLMLHITDCYLEELSKVSQGFIPGPALAALLRPFTRLVCSDSALAVPARRLLTALIEQSNLGLDYQDKTRAWQRMGCPVGGPEALELVEDDEDEEQSQHSEEEDRDGGPPPLDPRAGRVSVFLRALPVPAALLAAQLRALTAAGSSASSAASSAAGSRTSHAAGRRARLCADRFEALSCAQYPLALSESARPAPAPPAPSAARAARGLCALERALGASADALALKDLSRKRRKRLLAKTRAGLSIVEEVAPDSTIGEWQVEETETNRKDSDKENFKKKKDRKRKTKNMAAALDNKKPKINENGVKTETKTHTNKVDKKHINNEEKQSKVKTISDTEKINKNTQNETNKVYKLRNGGVDKNNRKINNNVVSEESDKLTKKINQEIIIENGVQKTSKPIATKAKKYQKQTSQVKNDSPKKRVTLETPKKVKFVLKNNSMQGALDYYQSVRRSPSIPYDGNKLPSKTNLKVSTPSPINPFFKKKFKLKMNM